MKTGREVNFFFRGRIEVAWGFVLIVSVVVVVREGV